MSHDPSIYPITANLADEAAPVGESAVARAIIDAVGEYEHGAADVDDIKVDGVGLTLKQYAAVALDIILILGGDPILVEVLNMAQYRADQSWNRETLIQLGKHRLLVEIRHNAYQFQSHSRVKRWDGNKWQLVATIPYTAMTSWQEKDPTKSISYTSDRPDPTKVFDQDQDELIRLALLVLG